MEIKRCANCMEELPDSTACCPACGVDNSKIEQSACALCCNYVLHERYLIGKELGQGGFGITYIGMDLLLNIKVAVKEYFPMGYVSRGQGEHSSKVLWNTYKVSSQQREEGYKSFLREAQKIARIDSIPSIVRVRDVFLENDTAYIIMDFVEGITLKEKLRQDGKPMAFPDCFRLLRPVMEGLEEAHAKGIIHRDISPDNIMIRPDGKACLIDFGAAKETSGGHSMSSLMVAKKGFSPIEQYVEELRSGPWTDVYAMCATILYCITGEVPDASPKRQMLKTDTLGLIHGLKEPLGSQAADTLAKGFAVEPENRIQSMAELLRGLDAAGEDKRDVSEEKKKAAGQKPQAEIKPDLGQRAGFRPQPESEPGQTETEPGQEAGKTEEKEKDKVGFKRKIFLCVLVGFGLFGIVFLNQGLTDHVPDVVSTDADPGRTAVAAGTEKTEESLSDVLETEKGEEEESPLDVPEEKEIEDSWEEIFAAIDDGSYKEKYRIGNYKPLDLGEEGVVNMQIAAFDTDELADGNGTAAITWISKELLKTGHSMNPSWGIGVEGTGTIGGWEKSEMRAYMNESILPCIPSDVRNRIRRVIKTQNARSEILYDFEQITEDDVWIPDFSEVFGTDAAYRDLFPDDESRIKHIVGSDSASWWWLRAAYHNNAAYAVGASGGSTYSYVISVGAVPLGFCT